MEHAFKELHWKREISVRHYLQPSSLEEALRRLAEFDGKAWIVAGGTDVILQLRAEDLEVEALVDLTTIPGTGRHRAQGGRTLPGRAGDAQSPLRLPPHPRTGPPAGRGRGESGLAPDPESGHGGRQPCLRPAGGRSRPPAPGPRRPGDHPLRLRSKRGSPWRSSSSPRERRPSIRAERS